MGLKLWKKIRLVRRFKEPVPSGGYVVPSDEFFRIKADVQTTGKSATRQSDGDFSSHFLKVYTDTELQVADTKKGVPADRIWFGDKWFECRSTRKSSNTGILNHWTAEFVEWCGHQDDGPDVNAVVCGTCLIISGTPDAAVWVDGTCLCLFENDNLTVDDENGIQFSGREITFEEFEQLAAASEEETT